MSIRITNDRPKVMWRPDDSGYEEEMIGTTPEWDWLFNGELKDKLIAGIKLIHQLNPGIDLRDAKHAYESIKPHRI